MFPEIKESFFENISQTDINEFIECAYGQVDDLHDMKERIQSMTANDFYSYCALGYKANCYKVDNLSPREQYERYSDGRDDGLGKIDPDSPEAFSYWYHDKNRFGGHPWEICRGGNSTHISLFVRSDEKGYYLSIAGDAWNRTVESVKFYLALHRIGLPIYMHKARILADRLTGKEKIGIVPEGVMPAYCESHFPSEDIIDFMNLPNENREELVKLCVWQKIKEVTFIARTNF